MTQNTNTTYKNRISAFLFGNRIVVSKGTEVAVNMPILVGIIGLLFMHRLTFISLIVALVLGYRFSIQKKSADDTKTFETMVQSAAEKVKGAAENLKKEVNDGIENWDGVENHH